MTYIFIHGLGQTSSSWDRIVSPSFIICGQKDRANRNAARVLADTIPNAKLFFVESAGHEVNIDAPAILADLVKECWFNEGQGSN